jgi:hypothetical protein
VAPPERFQISHESIVPKASSPRAARARAPGVLSSSHWSLVPEKYASSTNPVLRVKTASYPAARSASHAGAVRRSCHTIALATGRPVARSHSTVVSRWLVMPIAATAAGSIAAFANTSAITPDCVAQISVGSCSTHPGRG